MRVLCLPRYDRLGASSRLRMYQYAPYLEDGGLQLAWEPFFSDRYLETLYSRRRGKLQLVADAFRRRLQAIMRVREFDLIWLEKEALPWLPDWAERRFERLRVPYVVDYDDAIFHNYDLHRLAPVRRVLGEKIDRVMRRARIVVAGNDYLADRARTADAPRVEIVPTVVDLEAYDVRDRASTPRRSSCHPGSQDSNPPVSGLSEGEFTIGWIGTPSTAPYLHSVGAALASVCRDGAGRLTAIGSGPLDIDEVPIDLLPWREESQTADISRMDAGIMPLPDESWERGKCGYKLIQYMACGLPVVASPVGVNSQIVEHGVNGFLASSTAEWRAALTSLRDDPDLRARLGAAGRKKVERSYSLRVTAPMIHALLREASER